eukprot:gene13689-16661_t
MKRLIVFDLDGTLAESKAALDKEMALLLGTLLKVDRAAIISGGDWPQFEKQVISQLPEKAKLAHLSILPTCGTKFFKYGSTGWKKIYSEDFTAQERKQIISALDKAVLESGFKASETWGAQIEDRGSQITFSALGQQAPLEPKKAWDPDFEKRKKIKILLDKMIPDFSVRLGGATSIDVTKPGIDKAYGMFKLRDILDISIQEMLFIGDALFEGGNDYPARTTGADCIQRLGVIMEPEPGNIQEAGGVLNPAAARGKDGELYLFPRIATKENYSRIGIAKVKYNSNGDPHSVERLGIALEPEMPYEKRPDGAGGCEDPRVTYVEPLGHYIMTYTAFSPEGPRIAMARSADLLNWERLGLVSYSPYEHIEFIGIDNKDASLFPLAIPSAHGNASLGMLHRPLFPGTRPEEKRRRPWDKELDLHRESIWLSYSHIHPEAKEICHEAKFTSHRPLAIPAATWEALKIGAGTPPVLTRFGWMFLYHGVQESERPSSG